MNSLHTVTHARTFVSLPAEIRNRLGVGINPTGDTSSTLRWVSRSVGERTEPVR
jgi:hypothetical protein